MEIFKIGANIVVVARTFNPSIIDKHWMISNEIVKEGEIGQNCLFAPMVSQIDSKDFTLLVVPDQMQFIPKSISTATQDLITSKLLVVIEKLPHTPYIAVGINFFVDIGPKHQDFHFLNKKLFFNPDNPIFGEFNSEDARYGVYFSRNIFGCRLKLDIKPATLKIEARPESLEVLRFNFNFHRDLSKDRQIEEIRNMLSEWKKTFDYVNNFLENFRKLEG